MLRARLYEAEHEEAAQAEREDRDRMGPSEPFLRVHPYRMIKDLRTGAETSNTQAVLDGGLDEFMAAALAQRVIANRRKE